jgi:uncharacterized protein
MAIVNHAKKEINAKIVYYGPGLSGKTTNIKFIHEKMKPEYRGMFKFINTQSGKMYFFDFMRPDQIGIKDYNIRFHIYTVPGEVMDYAIWKTVLKGADGLAFIVDSAPDKLSSNMESLKNLTDYLGTLSMGLPEMPCVFQCNKQDIPGALTPQELKTLLSVEDHHAIPAVAQKGEGVLNTLSTIVKLVMQKLRETPLGIEEEDVAVAAAPEPVFTNDDATPYEADIHPPTCSYEEVSCETDIDSAAFHGFTSLASAQVTMEEIEPSVQETATAEIQTKIDFSGDAEMIAPGCFRLPITFTCGEMQKNMALTVAFSLENSSK